MRTRRPGIYMARLRSGCRASLYFALSNFTFVSATKESVLALGMTREIPRSSSKRRLSTVLLQAQEVKRYSYIS